MSVRDTLHTKSASSWSDKSVHCPRVKNKALYLHHTTTSRSENKITVWLLTSIPKRSFHFRTGVCPKTAKRNRAGTSLPIQVVHFNHSVSTKPHCPCVNSIYFVSNQVSTSCKTSSGQVSRPIQLVLLVTSFQQFLANACQTAQAGSRFPVLRGRRTAPFRPVRVRTFLPMFRWRIRGGLTLPAGEGGGWR